MLTCVLGLAACGSEETESTAQSTKKTAASTEAEEQVVENEVKNPKYVFMFIGDGMSYPQVQLTNYFVSANSQDNARKVTVKDKEKTILESESNLNMMSFPVMGSAQTYDSTSFAPDSASTATSIATGKKTWSGSINVSEDFSQTYETIAEKLKKQKDYKKVISALKSMETEKELKDMDDMEIELFKKALEMHISAEPIGKQDKAQENSEDKAQENSEEKTQEKSEDNNDPQVIIGQSMSMLKNIEDNFKKLALTEEQTTLVTTWLDNIYTTLADMLG